MFLSDALLPQRPQKTTTLTESRDARRDPLQLDNTPRMSTGQSRQPCLH